MYMSAFPLELRPDITTRLTIKYPDIHPDDGYDLKDMNSATQFIISSRSAIALLAAMMPQPPTPPMPAPPSPPSTTPTPSTASAQPLSGCIFCRDYSHRTTWCHIRDKYARQAKIKIVDGRIQFLDGNELNALQYRHFRQWFKEHIDVWLLRYTQPTTPRPSVSSNFLATPSHAGTHTTKPVNTEALQNIYTYEPSNAHTC